MKPPTEEEIKKLHEMSLVLFYLANDNSGDESGCASLYLHEACNNIRTAIDLFARGNPNEPIPAWMILRSMGIQPETFDMKKFREDPTSIKQLLK